MLSKNTITYLESACKKSNETYPEGGLIYTYAFGYKQAHLKVSKDIFSQDFSKVELETIDLFFESAVIGPCPKKVSEEVKQYSKGFIDRVFQDFKKMNLKISISQDSDSKTLELLFIEDSNYHTLELFWSID